MERIKKLISLVRPYYPGTDSAHDWSHINRVARNAETLAEGENVKLENVLAAVYCHDLVNLPKDDPDRKKASLLAANEARPLLEASGFNSEDIEIISRAIVEHSYSSGLAPSTLEAAIVQDADRLDTLGAIGILRCASINTQMRGSFYNPQEPLAQNRSLDDKAYMLDHYFVKLFQLPEKMNTSRGKALASSRRDYMKSFVETLLNEI